MNSLNKVQEAAFELVLEDSRFLLTLADIFKNAKNANNNYISMTLPYIGIFADGAEQWGRKVGFQVSKFSPEEKEYYSIIRGGHKLYEYSYDALKSILQNKLKESDDHFFKIRTPLEKIIGYRNFGADKVMGQYCGNTILCAAYNPFSPFDSTSGLKVQKLSEVAGKLALFYGGGIITPYLYSDVLTLTYEDFHFEKSSPIKITSFEGFILFSMLCNINYAIVFIENFFKEEIVQKFKFAYLQYYYLCKFVKEINENTEYELLINDSLCNKAFRNCLSHYGLGQFLEESDIKKDDPLKGLTLKAFNLNYITAKNRVYEYLTELANQIKTIIF